MIAYSKEAYKLMHDGAIALAQVEGNGMRVDTDYLTKAMLRTKRKIDHLKDKMKSSEVAKVWRKKYRSSMKMSSLPQLSTVLFDVMGHDSPGKTDGGRYRMDSEALSSLDIPFVEDYLRLGKLTKAHNTYLAGILREVVDGFVHPFFNLHLARTYRSSSDSPNFQNLPVRDPEIMRLIRRCFIARPGHRIVELDYSRIEVCVGACYHKDPAMITYIKDLSKDMHSDMAMACYRLTRKELGDVHKKPGKNTRYCSKNMFVFPQFYGDYYIDCARSLWHAISKMHLETADGVPLLHHLKEHGIYELGDLDPTEDAKDGTFEQHIQKVERHFWEKRFPVYNQWKMDWYDDYRKQGWFETLTGFICQGFMKRNEVINYGVQGSAFHCLLWALICLIEEMRKRKMRSLIVGQIHDSIVADVHEAELEDFLKLAYDVMVKQLVRTWKWICVPLDIEAEVAPADGTWADKAPIQIPA